MKDKIQAAFAQIHADEALMDSTMAYLRKEAEKHQSKSKSFKLPARVGAIAAMALLVIGIFSHNLYFTPAAHVSIDINPSVELTLNRFDRVIGTYAFNESGTQILREANLQGRTCDEAAALVLSAIEANGYIAENTLISVTVQAADSEKEQMLCNALLQFINENIPPVQMSAGLEVFPVTEEVWGNAHGCHMSPARYLAIQELLEVDENATMEDYTDTPIGQIRRRTQECRNRHNTESDGSGPESSPQNEQGHGDGCIGGHGSGSGHGYRGKH